MQNYKKIALACALLLALAGGWYFFAGRNDVSDIGKRADAVRNELSGAEKAQRDQTAALDRAAEAADRSQSAIRDSAERADRVKELERSDAAVIRESQSILEAVRGRDKKEN